MSIRLSVLKTLSESFLRKNKWDRLPACRFINDRLEAYPTYCSDPPKSRGA